MKEEEEEELILALLSDKTKQKAYKQLVNLYSKRIYWHVRKLVLDHDVSNDLVQEIFIKVYQNLSKFKRQSKLYTWIYTIATNEALNYLNKEAKKKHISFEEISYEYAMNLESDKYFNGDEAALFLQKQIALLPQQQRIVFIMKYNDEMKYEDISKVLNITVGALKSNYHHAVKKIQLAVKNLKYEQ
ncbi:MAG: RNA polymerase sigma factor [Solirubrobacteraceae bacterium]